MGSPLHIWITVLEVFFIGTFIWVIFYIPVQAMFDAVAPSVTSGIGAQTFWGLYQIWHLFVLELLLGMVAWAIWESHRVDPESISYVNRY